jgi:hypothetical protein
MYPSYLGVPFWVFVAVYAALLVLAWGVVAPSIRRARERANQEQTDRH